MIDAVPLPPEAPPAWRPLPPRAKTLFALRHATLGLVFAIPAALLASAIDVPSPIAIVGAVALAGVLAGAAIGIKRHASTAWRLDDDGLAFRRGRVWYRETRVPASRVQHLDLRHGPLERRWNLATLVVHTAGSKMSAVSVSGLDAEDAETLRDRLARQIETDDAL